MSIKPFRIILTFVPTVYQAILELNTGILSSLKYFANFTNRKTIFV